MVFIHSLIEIDRVDDNIECAVHCLCWSRPILYHSNLSATRRQSMLFPCGDKEICDILLSVISRQGKLNVVRKIFSYTQPVMPW